MFDKNSCSPFFGKALEKFNYEGFINKLTENGDQVLFRKKVDDFFANVQLKKASVVTCLEDLLDDHLVIAESHPDFTSKNFLIKNMARFAKAGFTLVIENLFLDNQEDMDKYFYNKRYKLMGENEVTLARINENLQYAMRQRHGWSSAAEFKALDARWKLHTYNEVIKAAKKAGVRIVAGETQFVHDICEEIANTQEEDKTSRLKFFNYTVYQIIQGLLKTNKALILTGAEHAKTTYNIPGVSDLLGARTCYSFDSDENFIGLNTQIKFPSLKNSLYEVPELYFSGEAVITNNYFEDAPCLSMVG